MRVLITAGLLLAAASATAETAYYRVELFPSGSLVSIGSPVVRGATVLIHKYPDGTLMSLRKSDVRGFAPITAEEAATPARKSVVAIGNLAMQGGTQGAMQGSTQGPSASARPSTARDPGQTPRVISTLDGLSVTIEPKQ